MDTASGQESYFQGKHLFCFGFGYVASFLASALAPLGCKVSGTTTDPEKKIFMHDSGYNSYFFDLHRMVPDVLGTMKDVTHVLLSIPPSEEGDLVYEFHGEDLVRLPNLEWVGYLSAASVYGNHDGAWVDENTLPAPTSRRGSHRLKAEEQWKSLYLNYGLPIHTFRMAGIYGPGRSAVDSVRSGTARRLDKPGHVFNRIHVDDIVQVLMASMSHPKPGSIYNVADDLPSPSHEIIQFACNLLGMESPPLTPFSQTEVAPIMGSFYKDNKRIRNDKIKRELGIELLYSDYKKGLQSCLDVETEVIELLEPDEF